MNSFVNVRMEEPNKRFMIDVRADMSISIHLVRAVSRALLTLPIEYSAEFGQYYTFEPMARLGLI